MEQRSAIERKEERAREKVRTEGEKLRGGGKMSGRDFIHSSINIFVVDLKRLIPPQALSVILQVR